MVFPTSGARRAGGYHHHLGLNTWESRGGSPPPPGTTGLYHVAIRYPTRAARADALRRLEAAGIHLDGASDHGVSEALYLHDPDGNGLGGAAPPSGCTRLLSPSQWREYSNSPFHSYTGCYPMDPIIDFWQEYKLRLRRYIARRVRGADAVDDILQDVFLKAHTSLHTVKSPGSVSAWLFRIAANAIVDHYRSEKPWAELPAELSAPEPEPDYVAELAACLQPLIADLPESYRSALMLSEIEGMPQKEVARRLGLSLSGAKSRVQRGREKLRQRLLDCCTIETGRTGVIIGYERRDKTCGGGCG